MTLLVCYNRGCGRKFVIEENNDDVCQHHPGEPVFHDAYKGWSCCKKKTTDFTEFLNIKGCAKSKHSNIKPVEPEKPKAKEIPQHEEKEVKAPPPKQTVERPSADEAKSPIKSSVSASLKDALKRHLQKQQDAAKEVKEGGDAICAGAPCKRNGCSVTYQDNKSEDYEDCIYHKGYPVFHEGMKFWTCCQRKTSDFDEFLKQIGCESGQHCWLKASEVAEKQATCRYDWYQTGPFVFISIYAKVTDPEKSYVEANRTNVALKIAFNGGINVFELQLELYDLIIPETSTVNYLGTKVEIKLRKENAFGWKTLEYKK